MVLLLWDTTAKSTFHLLTLKLTKQQRVGNNMQTIFWGIKVFILTRYKKAAKIKFWRLFCNFYYYTNSPFNASISTSCFFVFLS